MNGAMGIVVNAGTDGSLLIEFDGRAVEIEAGSDALGNVQLAYATSIHKVQGCEFPCAVIIAHKSHSFTKQLYTLWFCL
jgi:exodeoxyribonuclease V alpha subunit